MRSKISTRTSCEIEDGQGNTITIGPELDDNGNIQGYIFTCGGMDFILSSAEELEQLGETIVQYGQQEQKKESR